MKSLFRRLREPSTHSALAVAGISVLPAFGASNELTLAIGLLLSAAGVILPEGQSNVPS